MKEFVASWTVLQETLKGKLQAELKGHHCTIIQTHSKRQTASGKADT
jgi:hypothetical protein